MRVYTPLQSHRILLHAAIASNVPSPGRELPGNHVGSLRLLSSQLQIQPTKKGKQWYLVFLPGFYFSLTFLFSVPVLVFAAMRQSMQKNMPSYSSTLSLLHLCFQLLNCLNFSSYTPALEPKNRVILFFFNLTGSKKFLFTGGKYETEGVSVVFSGLAQAIFFRQSVVWFNSVGPSLGGKTFDKSSLCIRVAGAERQ